ncbi:hypothetical protein AVEN_251875-1 [Araneus ventricosus]|uniref:Uncharacterized protein n=1 Tax=Araneus ventricosus TaxID=182803 RepID=A0A4Y2H0Y0_ARAVE|nr:hypothetical protein AVEN_251875-1 [Araneus ventricosus]
MERLSFSADRDLMTAPKSTCCPPVYRLRRIRTAAKGYDAEYLMSSVSEGSNRWQKGHGVELCVERRHHLRSVCLQDVALVDQTDENRLELSLGSKVDDVALTNQT